MEPIRYVARLNAFYRSQGFPPYKWSVYETAPLTPLTKSLSQCRVALLISGGMVVLWEATTFSMSWMAPCMRVFGLTAST